MALKRTPDEILSVFDQAQERLGEDFDMRSLLWETFGDILSTIRLHESDGDRWTKPDSVYATVEDYLVNNYGDD